MKSKHLEYRDVNGNETLPQKLFKGTFVVFTVIALLELPNGVIEIIFYFLQRVDNENLF